MKEVIFAVSEGERHHTLTLRISTPEDCDELITTLETARAQFDRVHAKSVEVSFQGGLLRVEDFDSCVMTYSKSYKEPSQD